MRPHGIGELAALAFAASTEHVEIEPVGMALARHARLSLNMPILCQRAPPCIEEGGNAFDARYCIECIYYEIIVAVVRCIMSVSCNGA